MNKKILDVTAMGIFCICLIVAANFQEWNTRASRMDAAMYAKEQAAAEAKHTVTAGVSRVLSRYSFTTESDEKTGITKNDNYRVTTQEQISQEKMTLEEIIQEETTPKETVTGIVPVEEDSKPAEETEMTGTEAAESEAAGTETEENGTGETEETEQAGIEKEDQKIYSNRWNITLTEEEIDLLARIVWLEACGEPQEGQEAVVEVIFNRMASGQYPDTLYDVLSQNDPVQFCSWKNRDIAKPTEKEYQSVYEVLNGNTNILRNDTLYFSTEPLTPRLDVKIGGHSFCY